MTQFFSTASVIAVTGPACPAPAAAGSVYHGLAVVGLEPGWGEGPGFGDGGATWQIGLPSDACTLCRKRNAQNQSREQHQADLSQREQGQAGGGVRTQQLPLKRQLFLP